MILNSVVNPEYFAFHIHRRNREETQHFLTCGVGSFMFWCDAVSSIALLYDISYANKAGFEMEEICIRLNEYGVPVSLYIY
jgi:hypothetical protein